MALAGLVGVLLIALPEVVATHGAHAIRPATATPGPAAPPIGTPLPTASASPTATEAPSPAETATPAPAPSATASPTPTPTATPKPTPTATLTPTPSATPTPTRAASTTPTPTPRAVGPINATSLTGRVTDQATGVPLAGVTVYIYTEAGGYGTAIPVTTTDADGAYTFYSLDVRRYTLQFVRDGYRTEWWGGHDQQSDADTFPVALGEAVSGINATLLPHHSISGTITAAGSPALALAGVTVAAFGADGTRLGSANTDDDGGYAIDGLLPGRYTLRVTPPPASTFVGRWWHETTRSNRIGRIRLAADTAVTGKNAALAPGATITGRITDTASGVAIPGAWAYAYLSSGSGAPSGSIAAARADSRGDYAFTGLAAGRYTLQFSGGSANGEVRYVREWWANTTTRAAAVTFPVATGRTVADADAALVRTAPIARAAHEPARASGDN